MNSVQKEECKHGEIKTKAKEIQNANQKGNKAEVEHGRKASVATANTEI